MPDEESSVYEAYAQESQSIEQEIDFYKWYYQPPTEEEYNRLSEEHHENESSASEDEDWADEYRFGDHRFEHHENESSGYPRSEEDDWDFDILFGNLKLLWFLFLWLKNMRF